MDYMNKIHYSNKTWDVLCHENKSIFRLEDYNILPIWNDDKQFFQYGIYEIVDYQIMLRHLSVSTEREYPKINGIHADVFYTSKDYSTGEYDNVNLEIAYTGAIIIGFEKVFSYDGENTKYYEYRQVLELVFESGKVVTTIDHTRAMKRIRKNLELGLRNLSKKRDRKCIDSFIQATFLGDYNSKVKKNKVNHKITLLGLSKNDLG